MAGAIQNEINQILGTTAVAAGGIKHLKGQEENAELKKADVKVQDAEKAVEEYDLGEQIKKAESDMVHIKNDGLFDKEGNQMPSIFGAGRTAEEIATDLQKRQLALNSLKVKKEAIALQRSEFAKIIGGKR